MTHPNISTPAALIGEPTRSTILMTLCDGRAYAAGALADAAGVSAQSASNHLALLVEGGLLSMVRQGRHRYYRLASEEVARVVEGLALVAQPLRQSTLRTPATAELRTARCCYAHLAGRLGVCVHDALVGQGLLANMGTSSTGRTTYELSKRGELWTRKFIQRHGLEKSFPVLARDGLSCLDWTERRPHLAGPLGVQLLRIFLAADFLRRKAYGSKRSLSVSDQGWYFLGQELGIAPFTADVDETVHAAL